MQKISAVIFDLAGTVVDFGSFAPTSVFVEAFARAYDFSISIEEARVPMGLGKWDHIQAVGRLPSVAQRWQAQFGSSMTDEIVTEIYQTFMPLQLEKIAQHCDLIPGTDATLDWLANQSIKTGCCTGYPRKVLDALLPSAAINGFRPDSHVACDDLPQGGRPGAAMAIKNALNLEVTAMSQCLKVDDAVPGILEGRNAGMWTIGVMDTGNEMGLSESEFAELSDADLQARRQSIKEKLISAGAHYVIPSVAYLPDIVTEINNRLETGDRPG